MDILGLKDAKDAVEAAMSSPAPKIALIKLMRETWARGQQNAVENMPEATADNIALREQVRDLTTRLETAETNRQYALYDSATANGRLAESRAINERLLEFIARHGVCNER